MSYLSGIGLAACGRVGAPSGPGLPACLPTPRTFGCGYAALWGRPSFFVANADDERRSSAPQSSGAATKDARSRKTGPQAGPRGRPHSAAGCQPNAT